jgi:hypothetical protein
MPGGAGGAASRDKVLNEQTLLMAMIEIPEAVDANAIAAVDGIDVPKPHPRRGELPGGAADRRWCASVSRPMASILVVGTTRSAGLNWPDAPPFASKSMRAIVMNGKGGRGMLEYVERPDPVAGPGEALVEIALAGVNFMDIGVRQGMAWTEVPNPKILGVEGVGRVLAVGEGVEGIEPGQRVAWVYAPGSYAFSKLAQSFPTERMRHSVACARNLVDQHGLH